MSSIRIECRKNKIYKNDQKDYGTKKEDQNLDHELIISADQWFMNTESFFNNIKETLEKYFDVIEKKN